MPQEQAEDGEPIQIQGKDPHSVQKAWELEGPTQDFSSSSLELESFALFWTEIANNVPEVYWSHSSSLGGHSPSTPMTMTTTVNFTLYLISSCSLRPWYFS